MNYLSLIPLLIAIFVYVMFFVIILKDKSKAEKKKQKIRQLLFEKEEKELFGE